MAVRGLFNSCATPEIMRPMAAIFSLWASCCWSCRCAVTSFEIWTAPTSLPRASRNGEYVCKKTSPVPGASHSSVTAARDSTQRLKAARPDRLPAASNTSSPHRPMSVPGSTPRRRASARFTRRIRYSTSMTAIRSAAASKVFSHSRLACDTTPNSRAFSITTAAWVANRLSICRSLSVNRRSTSSLATAITPSNRSPCTKGSATIAAIRAPSMNSGWA